MILCASVDRDAIRPGVLAVLILPALVPIREGAGVGEFRELALVESAVSGTSDGGAVLRPVKIKRVKLPLGRFECLLGVVLPTGVDT